MDEGACNYVYYQYYGQNSNMVSSVIMYLSSNRDALNGLLFQCEISTALTLEDHCKSKVKLGAIQQRCDYQLQKDCFNNPVQLFLFCAINLVSIASNMMYWSTHLRTISEVLYYSIWQPCLDFVVYKVNCSLNALLI